MTQANVSTNKQVITFFVLTYALSWLLFFIGHQTKIMPVIMLGIWAPTLVSIGLTTFYFGRKGLIQMFNRFKRTNVKWYYWALLLLLPVSIHFIGRSIWQLMYDGSIDPFHLKPKYWLGVIIPSFLIAGFGEELGWRGFALPRLQRHFTTVMAAVVLAIVHLLWHLPTYWLGQGMHNVPFLFILAFVFPWTFIFNWFYNKSGGSLIFAVSFHAISNASLSIVRFMPLDSEVPIKPELLTQTSLPIELGGPYLAVCAVYAVVALIIVFKGKFNKVNTDIP